MNFYLLIPLWVRTAGNMKFKDELSEFELQKIKEGLKKYKTENPEVSVVIPVYNEEKYLFRLIYCFSQMETNYNTELIFVNNCSTDNTQEILNYFEINNIYEKQQGIAFARQTGLESSKGKYILNADADTLYPKQWINILMKSLIEDNVVCVYGTYSFFVEDKTFHVKYYFYELIKDIAIFLRRRIIYLNVLGFNFGFKKEFGLKSGGFKMEKSRIGSNLVTSENYILASEDGMIAMRLSKYGEIRKVKSNLARVWTSTRRINAEGGLAKSFMIKSKKHLFRLKEYLFTKK